MEIQNESEKFFERYLNLNGFEGKWAYEPLIPGKRTRPDYLLDYKGQQYFFEVKELRKKSNEPSGAAHIDPYSSLRKEINEARKQFKQFKACSCSLVVFKTGDSRAILDPQFVFGPMLGNLGLSVNINTGAKKNVFLGGGKMVNHKRMQPQNTTISAIVVLEEFINNIDVERAQRREEKKQGRKFTGEELVAIKLKLHKNNPIKNVPRVVVVENTFARMAFPAGLFVGPFDERWRWAKKTGRQKRSLSEAS